MEINKLKPFLLDVKQELVQGIYESEKILVEFILEYGIFTALVTGLIFWSFLRFRNWILKALLALMLIFSIAIALGSFEWLSHRRISVFSHSLDFSNIVASALIISFPAGFFLIRWIERILDKLKWKISSNSARARKSKTDIRTVGEFLPKSKEAFNPESKFNMDKGFFCGLNSNDKPVYIDEKFLRNTHSVILGPTGFGKGAACQMRLVQHIREGDCVICVDPKYDQFMPHVLNAEANKAGREFVFIDLGGDMPQLNLLDYGTIEQQFELYCGGFGLSDRGEKADYYQKISRNILRKYLSFAISKKTSFRKSVSSFIEGIGTIDSDQKSCIESLKELSNLRVLQAEQGLELEELISSGAVIYVKGSIRNDSILIAQKMLIIKLLQICESKKHLSPNHTVIMLDEIKYLLSKTVLQILGTARDSNVSAILCMQSLQDINDCGKDLNPLAVKASITENCLLKLNYRVIDPDTRDWLARLYGTISVDDETRNFSTSTLLTEFGTGERSLRQIEAPLIDTNMLAALPSKCAVLCSDKLPEFIFTSPIPVELNPEALRPTPVLARNIKNEINSSIGEELVDVD